MAVRRSLDLSRPDLLFGFLWGTVLILNALVELSFTVDPDPQVQWVIVGNIASFFVIYALVQLLTSRKMHGTRVDVVHAGSWDTMVLLRFLQLLLYGWALLYVISIVFSGGLPIIWLVTNPSKGYGDFGVPTLSGLLNMVRAFVLCGYVLLYSQTRRRSYLIIPFVLFFTALLELSRGAMMVLITQGLAILFLRRRASVRGIMRTFVYVVLGILAFGALSDLRGTEIDPRQFAGQQEWLLAAPLGVFLTFAYLISPINNLYYGAATLVPSFTPYYTLATLLPTVLRSQIFPEVGGTDVYPVQLKSEAFNATSFYSPLGADFGWIAAGVITCLIQVICSYVHVRAKRGSYYYTLVYPPLFMSVFLSVFYMYFFSLVTVAYPLLVGLFMRYRNARLERGAALEAAGSQSRAA